MFLQYGCLGVLTVSLLKWYDTHIMVDNVSSKQSANEND
jgi:hypothetical protein